MAFWLAIIQLSELLENYNLLLRRASWLAIIQLSELLENYNRCQKLSNVELIIQLSELLENYNYMTVSQFVQKIIQLSELLENYNEKSAHRWVGNFSLQILTDLHPSKTPRMANFPFPTRVSVFGLGDAICGKECRVWPRFSPYVTYPRHDHINHTDSSNPSHKNRRESYLTLSLRRQNLLR